MSLFQGLLQSQATELNGRARQAEAEAKEAKERETQIRASNKVYL